MSRDSHLPALERRVAELEQLAANQALAIRLLENETSLKGVVQQMKDEKLTIRRISHAVEEPVSSVGRWCGPKRKRQEKGRHSPVRGNHELRSMIKGLCE